MNRAPTPQEFSIHDSLAEHYAAIGAPIGDDTDCAVHRLEELQPVAPYVSPLFRVNYYSIVWVRTGSGFYIIDGKRYPIRPKSLFFTNPGHIKGYGTDQLVTGLVIGCSEAFLKQYVHQTILDECPFLIAEVVPPHDLAGDTFQVFDDLATHLLTEYQSASPHRLKTLGSFLMVLLLKLKEQFWSDYDPMNESDGETRIVRAFKQNLEAHYRTLATEAAPCLYQVQDYAAAQHLHPNYLSTIIKRKTGKTVKKWIAEKTVAEAGAQLIRTHASIQRVAYRIGFKDAAHFSRFFKAQTGLSPSAYRQQAHNA